MNKIQSPFWVIVRKEVADHVRSWKFIILIAIIALTCMGSLYTALTNIGAAIKPNDPDGFIFVFETIHRIRRHPALVRDLH